MRSIGLPDNYVAVCLVWIVLEGPRIFVHEVNGRHLDFLVWNDNVRVDGALSDRALDERLTFVETVIKLHLLDRLLLVVER